MNSYPATIDNGHGERLTFLGRTTTDNIEYLEVENEVIPGSGPPLHVHHQQNESLTVIEGKMAIQLQGSAPRFLGPGESATFQRGEIHRFWNAGETPLKCKGRIWPALNVEYFLTEIFRSAKASGRGRPALFDAAFLLSRYRSEFDMMDVPIAVKKIIFPLALAVGKMRRLDKKYSNAPLPY